LQHRGSAGLRRSGSLGRHASAAVGARLTPYDAVYVALAEALEVVLVAADRRLSRASGIRCAVDVLS